MYVKLNELHLSSFYTDFYFVRKIKEYLFFKWKFVVSLALFACSVYEKKCGSLLTGIYVRRTCVS